MMVPVALNDRWPLDFVLEGADGRRFRILTIVSVRQGCPPLTFRAIPS